MNSDEREERLKEIRENLRDGAYLTLPRKYGARDVGLLLSLIDSQAASSLTGFGKPEDEARRILTYAKDWIGDANYRVLHAEIVKGLAGLYSELDQITRERDDLRLVVDVATNDDPATSLSKLHKIQHVAATRIRDKCVEKVKAMRDEWESKRNGLEPFSKMRNRYDAAFCAANEIITALRSLTLDQVSSEPNDSSQTTHGTTSPTLTPEG